ncbi:MAG: hypothetical protein JNK10_07690 [Cyclobacteriaceae bacterium]|nr:hypothetical protein [Cyclobacteriaceae bacterium]
MEKITTFQEDSLQDFLDGKLEGPALQQLKHELASSPALQHRLEELRRLHQSLSKQSLQSPSSGFVAQVMKNLGQVSRSAYPSPRNGIMLLLGVMVATGMLVIMISAGVFDQIGGLISLEQLSPVKKYIQPSLPSLPINGKLIIQLLVGINLILAFIVLDRTVLRPFFQRRAGNQWT